MAKPDQSFTDASASTDTTTYTLVTCAPPSDIPKESGDGHHAMRVGGSCDQSSGTATVLCVLRSASRVYKVVTLTFTPSATRTVPGGGSGDYVATVTGGNGLGDWVDLYGADNGNPKDPLKWYVGVSAFSTVTSVQIDLYFVRS
jgi:hypothetical protein